MEACSLARARVYYHVTARKKKKQPQWVSWKPFLLLVLPFATLQGTVVPARANISTIILLPCFMIEVPMPAWPSLVDDLMRRWQAGTHKAFCNGKFLQRWRSWIGRHWSRINLNFSVWQRSARYPLNVSKKLFHQTIDRSFSILYRLETIDFVGSNAVGNSC